MNNRDPGNLAKGDQRSRETDHGRGECQGPNDKLSPEEMDAVSILGTKIGLAIRRGNRSAVYELVENGLAAMRPQLESPMLDLTLAEVGIDLRSCNILESRQILKVRDLLNADRRDLLAIPNFGDVSMIGIFAQLASFSLNRVFELEQRALGKCG